MMVIVMFQLEASTGLTIEPRNEGKYCYVKFTVYVLIHIKIYI